jgi:hypothetical protein
VNGSSFVERKLKLEKKKKPLSKKIFLTQQMEQFMDAAFSMAKEALDCGEVPVCL